MGDLDIEAGNTTGQLYGLAVDYGSTTLVMQVVDLHTGETLAQQTAFNPQIPYGEEILSRIFYTKDQQSIWRSCSKRRWRDSTH